MVGRQQWRLQRTSKAQRYVEDPSLTRNLAIGLPQLRAKILARRGTVVGKVSGAESSPPSNQYEVSDT